MLSEIMRDCRRAGWLTRSCLLVALTLVAGCTRTPSHASGWAVGIDDVESLKSSDVREVNTTASWMCESREELIKRLIALLEPAEGGPCSLETQRAAAFLLGELRASEAAAVLARRLENDLPDERWSDIPLFGILPVFSALVCIGRPSVPHMIRNIESSDSEKLRNASLGVLNHVLGGKRRVLELLGKLETRAAGDKQKLERIRKAIERVRAFVEAEEPLY